MTAADLATVVDRARVILLDFDGPVCSIFAQHPASAVAHQLRKLLVDQAVTLPTEILTSPTRSPCCASPPLLAARPSSAWSTR